MPQFACPKAFAFVPMSLAAIGKRPVYLKPLRPAGFATGIRASRVAGKIRSRAQILPISAAVRGEMSGPQAAATPENSLERNMKSQRAAPEQRRERAEMDPRFGKIGISAVAAALRYASDSRNPAYAPASHRVVEETDDAAA